MTVSTERNPLETHEEDERVMSILQGHVPLSLLVDLTDTEGPQSAEILAEEGSPEDHWWEGSKPTAPQVPRQH